MALSFIKQNLYKHHSHGYRYTMNWLLNPSRMSVHSERIIVWHVYATTVSSTHRYTPSLFPMPSSSCLSCCLEHPNHAVLIESLCVYARFQLQQMLP